MVIAASVWGKIKTVTQMIALISAFVDIGAFFSFINGGLSGVYLIINIVTSVMMLVSTIATIFSGIDYIWKGRKILSDK